MGKLNTGIVGLDELIGGGIESGSRNILYGPPGTGKTVFAMQFLWHGLQQGEAVAYDVMDKPFPRLIAYFKSFGWDIEPYIDKDKFIAVQAFPHFDPYPRDPRVCYFNLADFDEMKRIDKLISDAQVTRFAAGDFSEQLFALYDLKYMEPVEDWTINWSHYDDIVNIDVMTAATQKDLATQRATDLDLNKAHNIFFFRFNEATLQRELRIVKMEGCEHPLGWIPFRITGKGIELIK
ncbi:MAG: ATPase domain-containing protein, partial [Candidatus Bathyarchaeia archaeon]